VRSGQPCTRIIPFDAGLPDGVVTYSIYNGTTVVSTGTLPLVAGAVSALLQVAGAINLLTGSELSGHRRVLWSYFSSSIAVSGEDSYEIQGIVPFGPTPAGVRLKLGLESANDLADDQIPLVKGYLTFQDAVNLNSVDFLSPFLTGTELARIQIKDAIEAEAALELIPILQVRVAKAETSGTNTYERQDIDWYVLVAQLRLYVSVAALTISPINKLDGGNLFVVAAHGNDLFPT
jgi:hypothetical protein